METITINIDDNGHLVQDSLDNAILAAVALRLTLLWSAETRIKVGKCPNCAQSIRDYKIIPSKLMMDRLAYAFRYCKERPESDMIFKASQIRKNDNAGLANLIWFGLLYRPEGLRRGWYGINKQYVSEFFAGTRSIPAHLWKNVMTKEYTPSEKRIYSNDIMPTAEIEAKYGDIFTEHRLTNEVPNIDLDNQTPLNF